MQAQDREHALAAFRQSLARPGRHELRLRLRSGPDPLVVPCLVLSADAQPEQVQRALAAGFEAYWTKPVDTAALVRDIGLRLAAGSAR